MDNIPVFIKEFFSSQLKIWDLAGNNFALLNKIEKKPFSIGNFKGWVQFNSARKVSNEAKVDAKSISERKCFLCKENRPVEQKAIEIIPDWELLVNPFPIFDLHFTIANKNHMPQKLELEAGQELASKLQGMVVFYNDDGAGASAPDHNHYQAVPKETLPLINYIENNLRNEIPFEIFIDVPFSFKPNWPVNAFFWIDSYGRSRNVIIPRKSHRPELYFLQPPLRRSVSPGAIDMTGVIITPYSADFNQLTDTEIATIYSQVAFPNGYFNNQ